MLSRLLSGLEAKNLTERVQVGPLFCNRSYASIYRGTLVDRVSTSGSEGTRQIVIKRFVVPMENQSKFIKVCLLNNSKFVSGKKYSIAYIAGVKSLGQSRTPKYSLASRFYYAGSRRLGNAPVIGI